MKAVWFPMLALGLFSARASAQSGDLPPWLRMDQASQVAELDLTVTHPPGAPGARINGESDGAIQVVVPRGWTVRWTWVNGDSAANHSLVVMTEREKLPTEGGTPAFTNALTRSVRNGMPPGGKDVTTFVTEDAGWYWVLCGVPGHAIAGEYIGLRVDPAARGVSVSRKQGG